MDERARQRAVRRLRLLVEHDGDPAVQAGCLGAWFCHQIASDLGLELPSGQSVREWMVHLLDELDGERTPS